LSFSVSATITLNALSSAGSHGRTGYSQARTLFFSTLLHRGFFTALWLEQRATLGAQIALLKQNRVLLVQHTYKPGWHLPGGGVDSPESPAYTAERGLFEETAFVLSAPPNLVGILPYHRQPQRPTT
jgi:8-oxo-dGTP pyrophosphatase MutT (NUDIX family)